MKNKCLLVITLFLLTNSLIAQIYKRDKAILNLFTINDTLKYFEFYTSEMVHEDIGCGILIKHSDDTFIDRNARADEYKPFSLIIKENTVSVLDTSKEEGFIPASLNGNFSLVGKAYKEDVSKFHLSFPIIFKTLQSKKITVYKFPTFEAEKQITYFQKKDEMEEKWSVGTDNDFDPSKNKTWIAAVFKGKFLGWLLLSDVKSSFKEFKN